MVLVGSLPGLPVPPLIDSTNRAAWNHVDVVEAG
jgi:hypothetical protein